MTRNNTGTAGCYSSVLKENASNTLAMGQQQQQQQQWTSESAFKKRKANSISKSSDHGHTTNTRSSSETTRNDQNVTDTSVPRDPTNATLTKDWERLYRDLQKERVTKAEALLYAFMRESAERENLMKSYNQELENENQKLRSELSTVNEQKQTIQDLEDRLKEAEAQLLQKSATIQAFQQMTGATLSYVNINNMTIPTAEGKSDFNGSPLDCDCTVENSETKVKTKFRISTVSNTDSSTTTSSGNDQNKTSEGETILKYQSLENPDPLPDFLHGEIEFESSQLPPLLQNVLRGIFPEE